MAEKMHSLHFIYVSSYSEQSSTRSEWKTYQTRIISTANQVNLEFEEAREALSQGLANSIGGLF